MWSLVCLISALISSLLSAVSYFNGICHFGSFLYYLFGAFTFSSLGFYQLSRLYYCFANDQIHSDKGYPKLVFVAMGIMGALHAIYNPLIYVFTENGFAIKTECGINKNTQFYYISLYQSQNNDNNALYNILILLATAMSLGWDIMTLLMYYCKIRSFKEYQSTKPVVQKRINFILSKILIITLFYQITTYMIIFIFSIGDNLVTDEQNYFYIVGSIVRTLLLIIYSMSMYLMMEHNEHSYIIFLRIISCCRLDWICCCCICRNLPQQQLMELQRRKTKDVGDARTVDVSSQWETRNNSVDDQKIKATGNEMSIETVEIAAITP